MDALSTWFADKENPANATKQPLLKELFKLARAEERYKDNEIGRFIDIKNDNSQQVLIHICLDETSVVYVTSIERMSQGAASDIDELGSTRDEEEQQRHTPISSNASPQRVGPTHATMSHQQNIDAAPPNHMQGVDYPGELMVRGTPMPHSMLGSELASERPTFEVPEMMNISNVYPGQHDSSRKSSTFASPPDYASPTTPMYHHWQTGSTPPNNQPVYSFAPHAPGPSSNFVGQHGVHMTASQPFLGPSFDGLARPHEPQAGMFRPGGIGQSSLSHQPSYYETPTIPADVKVENTLRNPPH